MAIAGVGVVSLRSRALGFRREGFEDFLAIRYWRLDLTGVGTARGVIGIVHDGARSGRGALRIGYDSSRGGQHVVVTGPPPRMPNLRGMRFWVRNPGGNPLAVRVRDAAGHVFQRAFGTRTGRWEQVEMVFGMWDECWDGPSDRVFHYPPRRIAFVVACAGAQVGEVLVDDLEAVGADEIARRSAWYTVLGEPHRRTIAGGHARFRGDIELEGRPLRLRARFRGAAPSSRCFVRVGSGWTEFTTRAPIRTAASGQVAEVSMEELGHWRFEGFLADGLAAPPLRLKEVRIEPGRLRRSGPSDRSDRTDPSLIAVEALTLPMAAAQVDLAACGRAEGSSDAWACSLTNLTGATLRGVLSLSAQDWPGHPIASASRRVSLAAGASVSEQFSMPTSSEPCRLAEFILRTDRREYGPAHAAIATPAAPVRQRSRIPRWGMGTGLTFIPAGRENDARRERIAALAQRAGIRFGRELMFWEWIEPRRGVYRWERFDAAVNTLLKHGVAPYGIIGYWSRWTKPYTPEGIRDYAGFCRALVGHFRGRVRHWELWNEPNGMFWSGPKQVYGALVAAAYRAIKETDPGATVIAGSAAPMDPSFLRMVAATGAPFEAASVHPYGPDLGPLLLRPRLRAAKEASAHPDGRPRTLWVTETGSSVLPGTDKTHADQAANLARTYITAMGSGRAEHVGWVRLTTGASRSDSDEQLGILEHPTLAPRPAYRALQTIGSVIGDARFVSSDPAPDGISVERFRHRGRDALAVWSVTDPAVVALAWRSSRPPKVWDIMGRRIATGRGHGLAMLVLPRCEPILVEAATGDGRVTSAPIRLRGPAACLAGDAAEVRIELAQALAGVPIAFEAPNGWRASFDRPVGRTRTCRIGIPANVGPGVRLIRFGVGGRDGPIAVPLRLMVHSPVIPL
jgi:hypothetical protein